MVTEIGTRETQEVDVIGVKTATVIRDMMVVGVGLVQGQKIARGREAVRENGTEMEPSTKMAAVVDGKGKIVKGRRVRVGAGVVVGRGTESEEVRG